LKFFSLETTLMQLIKCPFAQTNLDRDQIRLLARHEVAAVLRNASD